MSSLSESSSRSSSCLVAGTPPTSGLFSVTKGVGSVLFSTGDKSSDFDPIGKCLHCNIHHSLHTLSEFPTLLCISWPTWHAVSKPSIIIII